MDRARHAELIQQLRARESELADTVMRVGENARAAPEPDAVDVGDRAADSYNRENSLRELDQDGRQLAVIREALRRDAEGTYGLCTNCGKPIEPKRLDAVPWAQYCIHCQQLFDQGRL